MAVNNRIFDLIQPVLSIQSNSVFPLISICSANIPHAPADRQALYCYDICIRGLASTVLWQMGLEFLCFHNHHTLCTLGQQFCLLILVAVLCGRNFTSPCKPRHLRPREILFKLPKATKLIVVRIWNQMGQGVSITLMSKFSLSLSFYL